MLIFNRFTVISILVIVLVLSGFSACSHGSNSKSLGTLIVNSGGISGSVPAGTSRVYTLSNLTADLQYTLRTSLTDTLLSFAVYTSEAVYESHGTPVTAPTPTSYTFVSSIDASYPTSTFFEVYFKAPESGNYVVVLSAPTTTTNLDQFFYDLRLMSSDVTQTLSTPTTTNTAVGGVLHIYNGGLLQSTKVNTAQNVDISFHVDSAATTTSSCPQVFIYRDSSLLMKSLLYSLVTDTTGTFGKFGFSPNGSNAVTFMQIKNSILISDLTSSVTITSMPFTSGTSTGPFIMIKGTATLNYYLTLQ